MGTEFFIPAESTKRCPICKGRGKVPCIVRQDVVPVKEGLGMLVLAMVNWDPDRRGVRTNVWPHGMGVLPENVEHALGQLRDQLENSEGRRRFIHALCQRHPDDEVSDEEVDRIDRSIVQALRDLEPLLEDALDQDTAVCLAESERGGGENAEDRHGHRP